MLSDPQIWTIKNGQRQARIPDDEYRDCLKAVAGVQTSKDPKLNEGDFDALIKYLEAIYWLKVDRSEIVHDPKPTSSFRQRDYWKNRNTQTSTSRQRFAATQLAEQIAGLEEQMLRLGYGPKYLQAVMRRVCRSTPPTHRELWNYVGALKRSVKAKQTAKNASLHAF